MEKLSLTPEKERIARGYDEVAARILMDPPFYDRCLGMQTSYEGNVLDVGCGQGFLLQKVHARAPQALLFGVNISDTLCSIAVTNNPSATIRRADAEALPFADDTFDTVLMTEVLEHLLDYDKAVSEVSRVLKKSGTFIVTVPNRDWASYDFYNRTRGHWQPVDDHFFRFAEVKGILERNHFTIGKYRGSDNLFYYGKKHRIEEAVAFFIPVLQRKMKRLIFKCVNAK